MSIRQDLEAKSTKATGVTLEPMINAITPAATSAAQAPPANASPINLPDQATGGKPLTSLDLTNSPQMPDPATAIPNIDAMPVLPPSETQSAQPFVPQLPLGEVSVPYIPESLYEGEISSAQYDYEQFTQRIQQQAKASAAEIRRFRTGLIDRSGITGPPGAVRYGPNSRLSRDYNIPTLWDQFQESPGQVLLGGLFRGFELNFALAQDIGRELTTFAVAADALVRGQDSFIGTRNPFKAAQEFRRLTPSTYLADVGDEGWAQGPLAYTITGLLGNPRNFLSFDYTGSNPFRDFLLPQEAVENRELWDIEAIKDAGLRTGVSTNISRGTQAVRRVFDSSVDRLPPGAFRDIIRAPGSLTFGISETIADRTDEFANNPGLGWRVAGSAALDVLLDPLNAVDYAKVFGGKSAIDVIDDALLPLLGGAPPSNIVKNPPIYETTRIRKLSSPGPTYNPRLSLPGSNVPVTPGLPNDLGPSSLGRPISQSPGPTIDVPSQRILEPGVRVTPAPPARPLVTPPPVDVPSNLWDNLPPVYIEIPVPKPGVVPLPDARALPPTPSKPTIYPGPAEPIAADRLPVINISPVSEQTGIQMGPYNVPLDLSTIPIKDIDSFRVLKDDFDPRANGSALSRVYQNTVEQNQLGRPLLSLPGFSPDDLLESKSPISQLYRWQLNDTNLVVQQQFDGSYQVLVDPPAPKSIVRSADTEFVPLGSSKEPSTLLDLFFSEPKPTETYLSQSLRELAQEAISPPVRSIVRWRDTPANVLNLDEVRNRYATTTEAIHPSYGDPVPASPQSWIPRDNPELLAIDIDEATTPLSIERVYQNLIGEARDVSQSYRDLPDLSSSSSFDDLAGLLDEYGYANVADRATRDSLVELINQVDQADEVITKLEKLDQNLRDSGVLAPIESNVPPLNQTDANYQSLLDTWEQTVFDTFHKYPELPGKVNDAMHTIDSMLDNYAAYSPSDIQRSITAFQAEDFDNVGRSVDTQAQNIGQLLDETKAIQDEVKKTTTAKARDLDTKSYQAEQAQSSKRKAKAAQDKAKVMDEVTELTKKANPEEVSNCFLPTGQGSTPVDSQPKSEFSSMSWNDIRKEAKARGIKLPKNAKRADYELELSRYSKLEQQPKPEPITQKPAVTQPEKPVDQMSWNEVRKAATARGLKLPKGSKADDYRSAVRNYDESTRIASQESGISQAEPGGNQAGRGEVRLQPEANQRPEARQEVTNPVTPVTLPESLATVPSSEPLTLDSYRNANTPEARAALIANGRQSIPDDANKPLWNRFYDELRNPKPTLDNKDRVKKLLHDIAKEKGPIPDSRILEDAYGVRYNPADFDTGPTSKAFQETVNKAAEEALEKPITIRVGDLDFGQLDIKPKKSSIQKAAKDYAREYPGSRVFVEYGDEAYAEYVSPFTLMTEHELRKLAQENKLDPYSDVPDLVEQLDTVWQDGRLTRDYPEPGIGTDVDDWRDLLGGSGDELDFQTNLDLFDTDDPYEQAKNLANFFSVGVFEAQDYILALKKAADMNQPFIIPPSIDLSSHVKLLNSAPPHIGITYTGYTAGIFDDFDDNFGFIEQGVANNEYSVGYSQEYEAVKGHSSDSISVVLVSAPNTNGTPNVAISLGEIYQGGVLYGSASLYVTDVEVDKTFSMVKVYVDPDPIHATVPPLSKAQINSKIAEIESLIVSLQNAPPSGTGVLTAANLLASVPSSSILTVPTSALSTPGPTYSPAGKYYSNLLPGIDYGDANYIGAMLDDFYNDTQQRYLFNGPEPKLYLDDVLTQQLLSEGTVSTDTLYFGDTVPKAELESFLDNLVKQKYEVKDFRLSFTDATKAFDYAEVDARNNDTVPVVFEVLDNKSSVELYNPSLRPAQTLTPKSFYTVDGIYADKGTGGLYVSLRETYQYTPYLGYDGVVPTRQLKLDSAAMQNKYGWKVDPIGPQRIPSHLRKYKQVEPQVITFKAYDDNRKPISNSPEVQLYRETHDRVQSVHSLPQGFKAPSLITLGPGTPSVPAGVRGFYANKANAIGIRPGAPLSTYIHEFGHALDRTVLKHNTTVIGLGDTLPIQKLFAAVESTPTFSSLRQNYENAKAYGAPSFTYQYHKPDGNTISITMETKFGAELLKPSEIWARLYEQYMSHKLDEKLPRLKGYLGEHEFPGLVDLMDELFISEGLLERKPISSTHNILKGPNSTSSDLANYLGVSPSEADKLWRAAYDFSKGSWKIRLSDSTGKQHPLSNRTESAAEWLNRYIELMPVYDGPVVRGESRRRAYVDKFIQKLADEGGFDLRAVSSFSSNLSTAGSFNPSYSVDELDGMVQMIYKINRNKSGVSIRDISYYPNEFEVIVPSKTVLQVTDMRWNAASERLEIYLDEVSHPSMLKPYTGPLPQLPPVTP